jgi:hypothetical protein
LLFRRLDSRGIGERDGVRGHPFPSLEIVLKAEFLLEFAKGKEQELANESQVGGIAGRDAVLGDGFVKFAEGEVDVRGSHEFACESGGEFGAEAVGFDDLALGASVEDTESWVVLLAEHATGAAVGERELAERRFVGRDARTGLFWFIHDSFLR